MPHLYPMPTSEVTFVRCDRSSFPPYDCLVSYDDAIYFYESVKGQLTEEENLFESLLEANNAKLILSGIAPRVDLLLRKDWEREHKPVGPSTQFGVQQKSADTEAVLISVGHDNNHWKSYEIGRRAVVGSEAIITAIHPHFSEDDVRFAGSLIDTMIAMRDDGRLLHLSNQMLFHLAIDYEPPLEL